MKFAAGLLALAIFCFATCEENATDLAKTITEEVSSNITETPLPAIQKEEVDLTLQDAKIEVTDSLTSNSTTPAEELLLLPPVIAVGPSPTLAVQNDNESAKAHPANESGGANEDEIPSFSEWTQKVLAKEEKSGGNGNVSVQSGKVAPAVKLRQKNYASPDCGAKILAANPEAEHTSAVLEPTRDEYFLSICSAKTWFVIELCEAIQAQRVEIADYEVYSSHPKDFRVHISDRYPTRDWALLGQFTAAEVLKGSIQSFDVERQLFGKFIKVELVSHYDKHHFCAISLFRVYGNSEYEVLDIEESRSNAAAHSREDETPDEEVLHEAAKNGSKVETTAVDAAPESGRNLFGTAKDAVINIVKKAAEALSKSPGTDQAKEVNLTVPAKNQPVVFNVCHTAVQNVNTSRAVNGSLSCQWQELNFLASLSWLQQPLTQRCQAELKGQKSFTSAELSFVRSVWGSAVLQALCHWVVPLDQPLLTVPEVVTVPPVTVTEAVLNLTPIGAVEVVPIEVDVNSTAQPITPTEVTDLDNLEQLQLQFQMLSNDMEMSGSSVDDMMPSLETKMDDPAAKPAVNNPPQQQQKESVFVRMSNRIKALERNMSLSGQYLEELSRRYKRQVDDMQKSLNRTLQSLNETLQRMSVQEESYQATLSQLQGELIDLRNSMQHEYLAQRTRMVEQHFILMMVEVVIVSVLVIFLIRRSNRPPKSPPPGDNQAIVSRRPITEPVFSLEIGQKVQDVKRKTCVLTVDVSDAADKVRSKASPTPSLADSSSSGCESAFSFPNSTHAVSRDPSPVDSNKMRPRPHKASEKKAKSRKKVKGHQEAADGSTAPFRVKEAKSSVPSLRPGECEPACKRIGNWNRRVSCRL